MRLQRLTLGSAVLYQLHVLRKLVELLGLVLQTLQVEVQSLLDLNEVLGQILADLAVDILELLIRVPGQPVLQPHDAQLNNTVLLVLALVRDQLQPQLVLLHRPLELLNLLQLVALRLYRLLLPYHVQKHHVQRLQLDLRLHAHLIKVHTHSPVQMLQTLDVPRRLDQDIVN